MKFTTFYNFPRGCAAAFATLLATVMLCCSATPQATAGKSDPTARRTISFTSIDTASNVRIKLMREDGSGAVTINQSHSLCSSWPRWSPDGTMLGGYAKDLRDDWGVMAMTSDGSREWVVVSAVQFNSFNLARPGILDSDLRMYYPCWLGNGAMIFPAYTVYDPSFFGEAEIYRSAGERLFIADDEGNIQPLTETPFRIAGHYDDADPHWSAVLDEIVFVSDRSGFDELYAIRPDGTGLTQITDFHTAGTRTLLTPVWSPLGDRIAVVVDFDDQGYSRDLLILDVDLTQPLPGTGVGGRVTGVDPFKVSPDTFDETPSWSPSGDRIVFNRYFHRSVSPSIQIVIGDITTGTETVIAETQLHDNLIVPRIEYPDWKPVP